MSMLFHSHSNGHLNDASMSEVAGGTSFQQPTSGLTATANYSTGDANNSSIDFAFCQNELEDEDMLLFLNPDSAAAFEDGNATSLTGVFSASPRQSFTWGGLPGSGTGLSPGLGLSPTNSPTR
jgi:hypothetical protein